MKIILITNPTYIVPVVHKEFNHSMPYWKVVFGGGRGNTGARHRYRMLTQPHRRRDVNYQAIVLINMEIVLWEGPIK